MNTFTPEKSKAAPVWPVELAYGSLVAGVLATGIAIVYFV